MVAPVSARGPGSHTVGMTELNRQWWDERVPLHVESVFYDLDAFRAGAEPPYAVWALDELGDVGGLAPEGELPLLYSLRARRP